MRKIISKIGMGCCMMAALLFFGSCDDKLFLPNDFYPLEKEAFRLYYTSASTDQQTIDVYLEDSFGQLVQLTFSFNNDSSKEEE